MSILITEKKFRKDLETAFSAFDSGPLLIHSDLLRIGIIEKMKTRDEMCADYHRVLIEQFEGRPLLFPTFNYEFCSKGIYNLVESRAQVGVLSSFLGHKYSGLRTRTPVFNFCIFNNVRFSRAEVANPFGSESTFAEMHRLEGTVAFLGAGFETNTFLHYVEEMMDVAYRYIKIFEGVIVEEGVSRQWKLHYRVRPLCDGAAEYEWPRLVAELTGAGILTEYPVGNGRLLSYRTTDLFDYWHERLTADPFYLLTESSRRVADKLFKKYGNPLTVETVEGHKGTSAFSCFPEK